MYSHFKICCFSLALKRHQKSKTGVSVTPQKDWCPPIFFWKNRSVVKSTNWNRTEIALANNVTMCMFWWKEQTFLSSVRSLKPRECRQQYLLNLGLGRRNVSRGNCKIKFSCMCGLSVSFVIIWKKRSSWTILKSQSYSSNAVVNIMQKEAV